MMVRMKMVMMGLALHPPGERTVVGDGATPSALVMPLRLS